MWTLHFHIAGEPQSTHGSIRWGLSKSALQQFRLITRSSPRSTKINQSLHFGEAGNPDFTDLVVLIRNTNFSTQLVVDSWTSMAGQQPSDSYYPTQQPFDELVADYENQGWHSEHNYDGSMHRTSWHPVWQCVVCMYLRAWYMVCSAKVLG